MSGSWQEPAGPALIEPVPIADTVVSGIARLERLPGGWLRAVLYVDQPNAEGEPEKVLAARLVGPGSGVRAAVRQLLALLDEEEVTTVPGIAH